VKELFEISLKEKIKRGRIPFEIPGRGGNSASHPKGWEINRAKKERKKKKGNGAGKEGEGGGLERRIRVRKEGSGEERGGERGRKGSVEWFRNTRKRRGSLMSIIQLVGYYQWGRSIGCKVRPKRGRGEK